MKDDGCGLGCGIMALGVGTLLLSVFVPFVGLPLGLVIMVVVIVGAWVTGKKKDDDE